MTDKRTVEKQKRNGTGGGDETKREKSVWRGFVDCELSSYDKAEIKKLMGNYGDAWSEVMGMVTEGYKCTLSYDDAHNTWNCSLTCQPTGMANSGLTLSGRGGSLQASVVCFWYKHSRILQGHWGTASIASKRQFAEDDVE